MKFHNYLLNFISDYRQLNVKRCVKMFPEITYELYKFEDVKDYHGETKI